METFKLLSKESKSFRTTKQIIIGVEAVHMTKKGQTLQEEKSVPNQVNFIHQLFEMVA